METTRKISLGTINGVRKGFKDVKSLLFVARIYGVATSAAVEPTPAGGTQTKFVGEFGAVNMERKGFIAPVAFLPQQAESMLHLAVMNAKDKPVRFAFDVFAEPNSTPVGYAIVAKPLIEPTPMTTLEDLSASLPELPAAQDLLSPKAGEPSAEGAGEGQSQAGEAGSSDTPSPAPDTKPAGKTAGKGSKK